MLIYHYFLVSLANYSLLLDCVCECVDRHHCWAAGPLGLGLSLYIVTPSLCNTINHFHYFTPLFQFISYFEFSRYIAFIMHLDMSRYISKIMYIEKPKWLIIWNRLSII
jgi:hypothetical protein